MTQEKPMTTIGLLVALAVTLATLTPAVSFAAPTKETVYVLPIPVASVDKALAPDALKASADQTDDPDVLLGLLYLCRDVDAGFTAIAEKLAKAKPDDAPAAAVVRAIVANADEASVTDLIARDGENALGHYLRAHARDLADHDKDARAAYQRATQCREMRLYEATTSAALFKALTALKLEGRDRLCALSWVATRASNFGIEHMQGVKNDLAEIAHKAAADQRDAMSDLSLVLAGHLYATNPDYRRFGDRALESAFRVKAELAAEQNSPKMNGYAAVTQALVSTMILTPTEQQTRDAGWFFPSRVYFAFSRANPAPGTAPLPNGPEFDAERQAGEALLKAAGADPDKTVGAYLKGLMPSKHAAKSPWLYRWSYVDELSQGSPELFAVATEYEKALQAAQQAQHNDPASKNMTQMMGVGQEAVAHAFGHGNAFADSLQTLIDKKAIDATTPTKSLLSGRPYVFAAAGEKLPEKQKDRDRFIVLYDDQPVGDNYQCVMADGHGEYVPVAKVKEQLKARGK
jgi:hypothetical protein